MIQIARRSVVKGDAVAIVTRRTCQITTYEDYQKSSLVDSAEVFRISLCWTESGPEMMGTFEIFYVNPGSVNHVGSQQSRIQIP